MNTDFTIHVKQGWQTELLLRAENIDVHCVNVLVHASVSKTIGIVQPFKHHYICHRYISLKNFGTTGWNLSSERSENVEVKKRMFGLLFCRLFLWKTRKKIASQFCFVFFFTFVSYEMSTYNTRHRAPLINWTKFQTLNHKNEWTSH